MSINFFVQFTFVHRALFSFHSDLSLLRVKLQNQFQNEVDDWQASCSALKAFSGIAAHCGQS
jgi:hypothetical protein